MDVGLNYMYSGMVYRTKKPENDADKIKNEILAMMEETLVRPCWFESEISEGRDIDPVPVGEEYMKFSTSGYAERWTKDILIRVGERIRYLTGAEVIIEKCRPSVVVNGRTLYEDFLDEDKEPMYVFFDIDGVLNKESMWVNNYSLDEDMVRRFCTLCQILKAYPVIMSSWRSGFDYALSKGNSEPIRRLEEMMIQHGYKILGKTENLRGRKRESEIGRYRSLHNEKFEYLILDDDPGEYDRIDEKTFFTDSKRGFTDDDVKSIMDMYNNRW